MTSVICSSINVLKASLIASNSTLSGTPHLIGHDVPRQKLTCMVRLPAALDHTTFWCHDGLPTPATLQPLTRDHVGLRSTLWPRDPLLSPTKHSVAEGKISVSGSEAALLCSLSFSLALLRSTNSTESSSVSQPNNPESLSSTSSSISVKVFVRV